MKKVEYSLIIDDNSVYFKKYLNLIKTTVDNDNEKYKTEEKRVRGVMSEESDKSVINEGEDYLAYMELEISETEQLMYRSFVISTYVFMEAKITSLCVYAEGYFEQIFSHKDISGRGVGRSIKYIEKVFGENFPSTQPFKFKFEIAQKIRNALVHNEGIIKDEDKPKVNEFIRKYPGVLEINSTGEIKITYNYAKDMVSLNKDICKEISRMWKC
ncbi:MAG: hypothetical protein UY07_C0017G0021 [Parcubacteria group bacterium GW2011_GWA1_47_8]|nr:hypothetical protein [uncultured bacterium]KKU81483.1 MAG: hypothetical protein UY07_C0017G0021 [Parcubacteria group bacterium GW2011_GWA1_47_8]